MIYVYQCNYELEKHITRSGEQHKSIPCSGYTLSDSPCYSSAKRVQLVCTHEHAEVFESVDAIEAHYAAS